MGKLFYPARRALGLSSLLMAMKIQRIGIKFCR
jgi:hypothetical protein